MRSSCPVGIRCGGAQQLPAHLERSRGDDDGAWIWRICCALSAAGSSCASHPPARNHHPGDLVAGVRGSSAPGDDHLHSETLHVLAGTGVSAHWSRSLPSRLHPRCLQLQGDDGECGGSCDREVRDPSAQTCG